MAGTPPALAYVLTNVYTSCERGTVVGRTVPAASCAYVDSFTEPNVVVVAGTPELFSQIPAPVVS